MGRKVVKAFDGEDYDGEVVSFDAREGFYFVRFEDGDEEEMDGRELEDVLVGAPRVGKTGVGGADLDEKENAFDGAKKKKRTTRTTTTADQRAELPPANSLPGHPSAPGFKRGARAVYHDRTNKALKSVQVVGRWMADEPFNASVCFRQGLDLRLFPVGEVVDPARAGFERWSTKIRTDVVPGYIGVTTSEDSYGKYTPWTPDYDGMFRVQVWDTERAVTRFAGEFPTAEAAAREYDVVAQVLARGEPADTNFPVTEETRAKLGFSDGRAMASSATGGQGGEVRAKFVAKGVFLALQLMSVEDNLHWDAVRGKAAEWDAWRDGVRSEFLHAASVAEDASAFAKKMRWLVDRVKPEAFNAEWTAELRKTWLERCDACVEWGLKADYFHDDPSDSLRWAESVCAMKKAPGGIHGGKGTVMALLTALEKDAISHEAIADLHAGVPLTDLAPARAREKKARAAIRTRAKSILAGDLRGRPGPVTMKNQGKLASARRESLGCGSPGDAAAASSRGVSVVGNKRGTRTGGVASTRKPIPPPRPFTEQPLPPGLKVLVVGAGVSGLNAATQLERMGAEVVVIEGRERIGGRVRSEELGSSLPAERRRVVDLGASFVCGTCCDPPVNPIFQYAAGTLKLNLKPKHRDGPSGNAWFGLDGARLPASATASAEEKYDAVLGELLDVATESADAKLTIDAAAQPLIDAMNPSDEEREFMTAYMSDLYVAPMEKLSLRGMVSEGFRCVLYKRFSPIHRFQHLIAWVPFN